MDKTEGKDIRLIVCDIDNTLLPAGMDAMSRETVKALHSAMDHGFEVMICTGRHYTFIPPSFFEDLPMNLIGTINGACLNDRQGHILEKHPMSLESMNKIVRLCEDNDIGLGFKFEDAIVTYANHEKFMKGYIKQPREISMVINDCGKKTHHLKHGTPLGTFLIGDENIIEPFAKTVDDLVFAWSHRHGYDVFIRGIDKSLAVESVLKRKNLAWDNVIAFGDAGNDTPFIEKAGIGVAMGNARDDVREHADIVAPESRDDGVARVLYDLGIAEE